MSERFGFRGNDEDFDSKRGNKRGSNGNVLAGLMREASGDMPETEAYNNVLDAIDELMEDAPDTAGKINELIDATDELYDENPKVAMKVKDTLAMVLEYLDMRSDEGEIEEDGED